MNLTTFSRLATSIYLDGSCVYLRSSSGVGKSSTIDDAVKRIAGELAMRLGFVVIQAPNVTPSEVQGYLTIRHDADGQSYSLFSKGFWQVTLEGKRLEDYDGGVILVDEADKADVDVKKMLGEMALSGRCGPHQLPPGWVVWMAGNRAGDRSGSTKELDHLINRRCEVDITPDLAAWEHWAITHGVHPTIVAFAAANPHIVFADTHPEKQGSWCTPRSLVKAGSMLVTMGVVTSGGNPRNMTPEQIARMEIPTGPEAVELAAGWIGQAAAAQLFATIRLEAELPKFEVIISSPGTAKLPMAPDAQMLTCYRLAALATKENLGAVIEYIERLPADFGATFAKSLCTRNPMFGASPPMLSWVKRNSSIMTTIALMK